MKILRIAFALLLVTAIMIVIGHTAGSFLLLKHLGFEPSIQEIRPWMALEYFQAYRDDATAGKTVIGFFAGSFAPAVVVALIMLVILVMKDSPMKNLHGDARFATLPELKKAGMCFTFNERRNDKWPAVFLGQFDNKHYVVDASQEYTSLAAPPGAGKGVGFVIPNLLYYPESILNFDPKTENFTITAGYRSSVLGQKVYRFSPDDPGGCSHCWNPLDYISEDPNETLADIRKITALLIPAPEGENQSFYQGAQQALDGLLLYLMESPEEERSIFNAWQINNSPAGIEKWILSTLDTRQKQKKPLSSQCANLLMAYANETEKKRDTTRSLINTYLTVFTDAKTRAATSKSDFDFNDLRKQKISVFVCIAPTNISRYSNMLNLFFSQALSVNTEVLPENDDTLKYQCLALLDEFVALGKIEIIRASAGYTRAYNMRYAIIFQNLAQVSSIYGQDGAQSLLETMHNNITYAVPDPKEAQSVSSRLGNTTVRVRETSQTRQQGGGSSTRSWVTQPRALMLPQEIQNMPYEEELVFKSGGRINPIKCRKIFWYKDKNFKDKANLPTPEIPLMVLHAASPS